MMKKYGLIAATMFASMASLQADSQQMANAQPDHLMGGTVMGLAYSTVIGGAVQVGYYGENWLVDIGANTSANPKNDTTWFTNVMGHLGGRSHLHQNLFLTYGAMGAGKFVSHKDNDSWTVGAFTGLDYQISKHFMVSGKVYPYNYNHKNGNRHNVFSNTTLSFFYVF